MNFRDLTEEGQSLFRSNLEEFRTAFLGKTYEPSNGSTGFYDFMITLATNNIAVSVLDGRPMFGISAAIEQAGGNAYIVWDGWRNTPEYIEYKKSKFAMEGVYLG